MPKRFIYLLSWLVFLSGEVAAQPSIQWQKTYGGSFADEANDVIACSDGKFVIVGRTGSNDGDVFGLRGGFDIWVIKVDSIGNLVWKKILGGTGNDNAECIRETIDGGYILAGSTESNNFDVSGYHGNIDGWIVKLNASGEIEWTKTLGGTDQDEIWSVSQTTDGGYITAGFTRSTDGDVTNNKGSLDYWIVKLDQYGNIQWQKVFGGSGADQAYSIKQTSDSGFIVAGRTSSNDGDVTDNNGNYDFWIIKLSISGVLEWQKSYGGSGADTAWDVSEIEDGYAVFGQAGSNDGFVIGHHGILDYWFLKLDNAGDLVWQKTLGGSQPDWGYKFQPLTDGGFILSGNSASNDGNVIGNDGGTDIWLVKLDASGNLIWQKTLGGTKAEACFGVDLAQDGGLILAGYTWSTDGDVAGSPNKGKDDFWIVKLNQETASSSTEPTKRSLDIFPNPASGQVNISVPGYSGTMQIRLEDITGRRVFFQEIENGEAMDIGNLPGGTYLLCAVTGSNIYSSKIVVK